MIKQGFSTSVSSGRGGGGDCCPMPIKGKVADLDDATEEIVQQKQPLEENLEFESHFNWLAPYSLSAVELHNLLDRVENFRAEMSDSQVTFCHRFANGLQKLILDTCLGNEISLLELEHILSSVVEEYPNLPPEQYIAYHYLLNVEKCIVKQKLAPENEKEEWKKLFAETVRQTDLSNKRVKATITAVKSVFYGLVGDVERKMSLVHELVNLDPDQSEWFRLLYYTLRRVRRERDYRSTPTDEEIEACQRNYELGPDCPLALSAIAELYNDTVRAYYFSGNSNKLLEDNTDVELTRQMLAFARRSVDQNPNSVGANIRLAEMFCNSGLRHEFRDLEKANEQFQHCLKEWPTNSHLLHKMGKFEIRERHDFVKGIEYLKSALEIDRSNYPCLMDYFRHLYQMNCTSSASVAILEQNYKDFVDIIDDELPTFRLKRVFSGRLKCMKAALFWKLGKRDEAIALWLEALMIDNALILDDVMEVMSGKTVFKSLFHMNDFEAIVATFGDKQKDPRTKPEDAQQMDIFVKSLLRDMDDFELFQNKNGNNPNWRNKMSSRYESRESGHILNRRLRYLSECDLESDWRSQCGSADTSSVYSESVQSYSTNYPLTTSSDRTYGNRSRGDRSYNSSISILSSSIDSAGGFSSSMSNLQRSRDLYGSSASLTSTMTQSSSYSASSSYSRVYGFKPPFNKKANLRACDTDDNWRR